MINFEYKKEYKEKLEISLEKISNIDDKISYVEKELFYVNMIDHWNDRDQTEYRVLVEKKRELIKLKEDV